MQLHMAGLLPRQRELAYFLTVSFKPRWTIEFCDVQPTMSRLCTPCLDDCNKMRADKTPWRSNPPVLTGTSRILVRHLANQKTIEHRELGPLEQKPETVTRLLECFESLRLMGWCDDAWKQQNVRINSAETLELYMNIAGNAYSGWAFLSTKMALLSTWGTFHPRFQKDPHGETPRPASSAQSEAKGHAGPDGSQSDDSASSSDGSRTG